MNKTSISFFVAGLLVGLLLATFGFAFVLQFGSRSTSSDQQAIVLKLAHGLDQNHPVHLAMLRMSELVRQKSDGTVELQVFPNGQLGAETECIEQVQNGALDMTKTSTAPMESFVPEMAILGLPYLFRDDEHCWRVLDGKIGQELLAAGSSAGLRGLCFYDAGSRNFYTIDKPILTPQDLKGLKIRVQKSRTAMDMVSELGGSPTPIPWGELYTALQQKMVDGAENNLPSFHSNRHFEVCKHFSMDEHTRVPDILLISEKVWSTLPANVQKWVQEAAQESSKYQRELWKQTTQQSLAAVQEAGVSIHYPDQTLFARKASGILGRYKSSPIGDMIQRIQSEESSE
jgi:tripartite ATP-independent transporter DctP family solute receptor